DEWEQRNPKIEDSRLAAELIEHLNANLEFYHHAIWWTMDPNRRYMLLDGYRAPGANGRSVASVIENRLIGITGNSLVMPVARGNHLDPRFPKGQNANLLDFYALDSPVPAARVSLPTRGVFAEAVMGSCNACEQIDDSRFWRWEESPIDEPPTIEPLSTATRRSEPANMQPTAFPTPIVSIQNAPSVPNPTGVGAVLQALGQESFRDMAGLAGTQANAAAAYQQALDTAYKFGKEASTLAQQAAMLKAGDKTMSAIDNAEADGKITADEAKELRMSALKKMVGETSPEDKASQQAEVDQKKATTDAIKSIPPENIKAVETPTAKVAAKPKPKPAVGPKVQNFPIGLKSHSTFTGGVQRPLDGNITLDISPTGNLASMAPISYLIPVNGGVGAPQQVSLAAGMYGVTVRYAPSKLSDLAFLREPQLESVGVNLGRLVEGVFDLMQKDLASDWEISAPVEGELFEVPDKCKGLSFSLLAEMVESPALSFDAELGADEGFTIAADGKVSFDSSKLAGLATTIAETLKIKQATLLAALLSLFTVQASIDNNKHITIAGAQKVKLNFKPAILKRFVLTQIK
ncbi:MAG TPA: hypothetical protein VK249_06785, partial [Anaerolineales bacterium]|nr:hypothetical protein [Anaerolineales bacterium]